MAASRGAAGVAAPYELGTAELLSPDALLAEFRAAERAVRAARARQVELIAEVEARRVTRLSHGLRASEWFAVETNCHGGEARSFVQLASVVTGSLPATFAALSDGRISWRMAEVLAREVTDRNVLEIAAIESELLAGGGPRVTFEAWRGEVRERIRRMNAELARADAAARAAAREAAAAAAAEEAAAAGGSEPDPVAPANEPATGGHGSAEGCGGVDDNGANPAADAAATSSLFEEVVAPADVVFMRQFDDGTVEITGRFHGAGAAIIAEQLEAGAQRAWHRHRNDADLLGPEHRIPGRPQLLAEALLDLCSYTSGALGTPLVTLRLRTDEPELARTATGQRLSGEALDLLLGADSRFRPLIETSNAVPLWFGTEVRLATPEMRECGMTRDGGCVFPGCTTPARWVSMHHTFPHQHGGPTSIEYCASLCDHHHRSVIHRRGWVMWPELEPDGHTGLFIIQKPNGERIYSQQHGRQPDRRPPDTPPPAWVSLVLAA